MYHEAKMQQGAIVIANAHTLSTFVSRPTRNSNKRSAGVSLVPTDQPTKTNKRKYRDLIDWAPPRPRAHPGANLAQFTRFLLVRFQY
jgi:hypothetical protein